MASYANVLLTKRWNFSEKPSTPPLRSYHTEARWTVLAGPITDASPGCSGKISRRNQNVRAPQGGGGAGGGRHLSLPSVLVKGPCVTVLPSPRARVTPRVSLMPDAAPAPSPVFVCRNFTDSCREKKTTKKKRDFTNTPSHLCSRYHTECRPQDT